MRHLRQVESRGGGSLLLVRALCAWSRQLVLPVPRAFELVSYPHYACQRGAEWLQLKEEATTFITSVKNLS